jgi:polyisoprenoid-binding protein YceI
MVPRTLSLAVIAALLGPLAAANAADTYKVDTVHSAALYRVKHMNASYAYGRFNQITGTFTIDAQDPSKCQFDFQVNTGSVDSGNPQRDQHLKSPDFLNAKQYPTITFKSKSVTSAGKDAYEVTGDMTLHGVTKPVTVKVEVTGTGRGPRGPIAGIESVFTIKRGEFGMTGMAGAVGEDIRITVSAEGMKG